MNFQTFTLMTLGVVTHTTVNVISHSTNVDHPGMNLPWVLISYVNQEVGQFAKIIYM